MHVVASFFAEDTAEKLLKPFRQHLRLPALVQRERELRYNLEEAVEERVHPAGRTPLLRFLYYWLGVLGPARREFPFLQPTNNLLATLADTWFSPLLVFYVLFAVMVTELALQPPTSAQQAATWQWQGSAALFALVAPIFITMVAVVVVQAHTLGAIPREQLRHVIGAHSRALSIPHALAINLFELSFMALFLRLWSISDETGVEGYAPVVLGCFGLGLCTALVCTWDQTLLYFSAWQPWEQARATTVTREERGEAFHFSVLGSKQGRLEAAEPGHEPLEA